MLRCIVVVVLFFFNTANFLICVLLYYCMCWLYDMVMSVMTEAVPTNPVQVRVWILRHVVVKGDVDSFDVHSSAEQVSRHQDASLKVFELLVSSEPAVTIGTSNHCGESDTDETRRACSSAGGAVAHLSSWGIALWMAMAGKFCSTSSWARAMQRCTDFTKITTYNSQNTPATATCKNI